ncbi:radical SAM protein [Streptomyces orinoci]|uniref:Radical SAM protein n=1 Tax=Streptomyces orinoci TaxID=67339 RepID=A0ABV3JY47_STRON|nr:radical SAM protein [Streptomyces orinoci]
MRLPSGPEVVVWDTTYACPLRCSHCYSESGRRPARQLDVPDLLRVTEGIIELRPRLVGLSGGEPLAVKGIFEVGERLAAAGIHTAVYTSGWRTAPWMPGELARIFGEVVVSVDGATARVHDRIRGRSGSFDRAMATLALFDEMAAGRRKDGRRPFVFGIDCTVMHSNAAQLDRFCTEIAPRFPELRSLAFNIAVPSGLASRPEYERAELLDDARVAELTHPARLFRLAALAPPSVRVTFTDNRELMMHPDRPAPAMLQVEPDGAVRAMPVYEGTVGNLLTDPPMRLWERALDRRRDPFVVETLRPVRTMRDWALAIRRIDLHFGSPEVRARIAARPGLTR